MRIHEANQILASDLKTLGRDAENLLKATVGQVGEAVQATRARLQTSLEGARTTCEQLQERTAEVARATGRTIRERPFESVGVAFAVGLVIGVLVSRK